MPTVPTLVGSAMGRLAGLSVTVNYPLGTTTGDFLLAFVHGADFDSTAAGTTSMTTISGWSTQSATSAQRQQGNDTSGILYRFSGGETSATFEITRPTTGTGDLPGIQVALLVFRGVDTANPINAAGHAGNNGINQGTVIAPALTTTVDACALAAFAAAVGTRTVTWSPSSYVEEFDSAAVIGDNSGALSAVTNSQATAGATSSASAVYSAFVTKTHAWQVAIAPQTNVSLSASDTTGTTADTAKVTADPKPTGDTGTGTEADIQRIALKRDPDTATATDTEKVTALVQPTGDTGSAAPETEKVTALIRPDSDTAMATETAVARFTARGDDAIMAVDTEKLTADTDLTETIGSTDTEKVTADIRPTGETITLVGEDARATYSAKGDDTAQADDTATSVGSRALQADTAAGTETHKVTATAPPATDTASATESASTDSEATASDASSPAAETQRLTIRVSDTATATDSARVQAVWTVTDTGTASDDAGIWLSPDGDTGSGTDSSFKSISGILDTPRLLTVPKDVRQFVVEKEVRRVMVAYDLRRIAIGKDLAPRSKMPHKDSRTLGIPAEERIFIAEREE